VALLLTAVGTAALATVRLRGPLVGGFLAAHFGGRTTGDGMSYGRLRDGQQVLDNPVICRRGDTADINLHGGEWIVRRVLQLATTAGFEVLPPSLPLPREAVDATSELQAEILQWLPLARTREAAASLLAQESLWRAALPRADEQMLSEVALRRGLEWLLRGPRVAIAGVPNAGKSTLANALLCRSRVIAADVAGTTRDWVEDDANVEGLPVRLIDTPGLREAETVIEREAIRLARPVLAEADLVLLLLDPTQPAAPAQQRLLREFPAALCVAGKSDAAAIWEPPGALRVSGLTGEGIEDLRFRIRRFFGCERLPLVTPCAWTSRQRTVFSGEGNAAQRIAAIIGDA
jgi:small GTP-binding protein